MTGTLNEVQVIGVTPGFDVIFPDEVHGANQLHPGEVGAVKLGHHGLHLSTVKHAHQDGFNHIVIVMPQGDLVASQLLGLAVQMPPTHPGTQVAGILFFPVHNIENIRFKDGDGDAKNLGVMLNHLTIGSVIPGIHHQKDQLKGKLPMTLQFLKQLGHEHGILAAGNAYGNAITFLHQIIGADGLGKLGE